MSIIEFTGELDAPKVVEFTGKLDKEKPKSFLDTVSDIFNVGSFYAKTKEQEDIASRMTGEGPFGELTGAAPEGTGAGKTVGQLGIEEAPMIGATAASLALGPMALPAWAVRLGLATPKLTGLTNTLKSVVETVAQGWKGKLAEPLIENAPRIAGAAGAGGAGGAVREAVLNPEATLESIAGQGLESAKEMGGVELLGSYVGTVIRAGLRGKPNSEIEKKAIAFAKEKEAPLSAGDVGDQMKAKVPTKLLLGTLAEEQAARKANQIINNEIASLTKGSKDIPEAVLSGQTFFRKALQDAESSMQGAFDTFEGSVGKDAVILLSNTGPAIKKAITQLERIGQSGPLMKRLNTMSEAGLKSRTLAELEIVRKQAGKAAKNSSVHDIVADLNDAIVKDYNVVGEKAGVNLIEMLETAKTATKEFYELRKIPGMERFAKEFGERGALPGTNSWIDSLFTSSNRKALDVVRNKAPEVYNELSATHLAKTINQHIRESKSFGDALHGPSFRNYVEKNSENLRAIYGDEVYQVLDNFSAYAKTASPLLARSGKFVSGETLGQTIFGWGLRGVEVKAGMSAPMLVIPGELGAYALSRALTNPNSVLFKAFTEGVENIPKTQQGIKLGGRLVFDSSEN